MKRLIYVFTAFLVFMATGNTTYSQWKKLAEKDLSNWIQINGTATYTIEKGVITGTSTLNSPNSFLCSKENYGDFILEFDTWVDPQLNSGVQIRSESKPDYQNGRVHGYQVELDPSDRAWSGGIYDESRRGWLNTLENNPAGQKAFKNNEWNHFRVEAVGNSIRTWINGIPCSDLIDGMTPTGFIALQVHSVGNDAGKVGLQVKWKNIQIMTGKLEKYLTPYTPVVPQYSYLDNTLTNREIKEGWKLLFDGKTSAGWMNAKTRTFPVDRWEINGGTLKTKTENGPGSDIVTTNKYGNFELIVDFKYEPGANSGIKYFVDTEVNNGAQASIGCEYQIIDDKNYTKGKLDIAGKQNMACLYDLIAPKDVRDNGAEKWNRATIIVKGNHIQHWLNGQMTVEYDKGTPKWKELVAASKFKNSPGFGEVTQGRILLQDHGGIVSFKNVKIKEVK